MLHEVLPGLWSSLCLALAVTIERSPPFLVQSPYTYHSVVAEAENLVLPRTSTSLWSFVFFNWVRPTLNLAYDGRASEQYPRLPSDLRAHAMHEEWKASCDASLSKDGVKSPGDIDMGRSPLPRMFSRLQWRIFACNKKTIIAGAAMECVLACLRYGPAWSVKHFLEAFEQSGTGPLSTRIAWAWLLAIVLSMIGRALLQAHTYANWNCVNTPSIRAQLNAALFRKTLRVSFSTLICRNG